MSQPAVPNLSRMGSTPLDPRVSGGIAQAARRSGVEFGFLLAQAGLESGFRADARATTSSAAGLFQFIEQTWLQMVQKHGPKIGLGEIAGQIEIDGAGRASVSDPALRRKILDLRFDPRLSAEIGAEYARENRALLEEGLGRKAGALDLYLAHFLGPGGATQFLKAVAQKGDMPAAELLPQAAAANRNIFFDGETGRALSVAEVHGRIGDRFKARMREVAALVPAGQMRPHMVAATMPANTANAAAPMPPASLPSVASIGDVGAPASAPARPLAATAFGGPGSWLGQSPLAQLPTAWLLNALHQFGESDATRAPSTAADDRTLSRRA